MSTTITTTTTTGRNPTWPPAAIFIIRIPTTTVVGILLFLFRLLFFLFFLLFSDKTVSTAKTVRPAAARLGRKVGNVHHYSETKNWPHWPEGGAITGHFAYWPITSEP